jgi:hypothetical protein
MKPDKQKSILQEAGEVITGPRRESYGSANESFERIATMWSVVLRTPVTGAQVGQCMIAFKLVREVNKHHRDNLVDIAGYTALLDGLNNPT